MSKGRLLDDIFNEQDYVWTTDQGKSFKAFWEFLMSRQKQSELEDLIRTIMNLPQVVRLKEQSTIPRIKNNLIEAGDKVNRTNDSLIEQLRKFVEQKSLLESKRILASIEEIEKLLIDNKDSPGIYDLQFEIDGIFKPSFFIGRSLFNPPQVVKFETNIDEVGVAEPVDDILFEQFNIDLDELKENIATVLRHQNQATLIEVVGRFGITRGIAELIAYYQIASAETKHFVNSGIEDEMLVQNYKSQKMYQVKVPQIIFNR